MSRLEDALRRIARDLEDLRRSWCVVGGLAVSARAEPRFTRDIDVAVVVKADADAEALTKDLVARGYSITTLVEQTEAGRLATIRLSAPGEDAAGIVVDLLVASSGIEAEVVAGAEMIEVFAGVSVPVASAGHLIALKVLSRDDARRPQDAVDLRALLSRRSDSDLDRARAALSLIRDRGFTRGRDLDAELARAVRELGAK